METTIAEGSRLSSDERLLEVMLYIAKKSENDRKFGAVKLNKLLWYADIYAYATLGESITGAEYQRLQKGPAPRRLLPVKELYSADFHEETINFYGHPQNRLIPDREPKVSWMTEDQRKIIDGVLEIFNGYNASQISKISHNEIGWKIFNGGDTIPNYMVFVSTRDLTEPELSHGRDLLPILEELKDRHEDNNRLT